MTPSLSVTTHKEVFLCGYAKEYDGNDPALLKSNEIYKTDASFVDNA
jgi:hypothetical protein